MAVKSYAFVLAKTEKGCGQTPVTPESIALFCLTPGGVRLAKHLAAMLPLTCFTREKLLEEGFMPFNGGFARTVRDAFASDSVLIFIGATDVAVRVLAPLINDTLNVPAVVAIDESGQHVVSLVSGHAGGANALIDYLAGRLRADPPGLPLPQSDNEFLRVCGKTQ